MSVLGLLNFLENLSTVAYKGVAYKKNRVAEDNNILKKAIIEQQKCLEKLLNDKNKNNVFITGFPNEMEIEENNTNDATVIINHMLSIVSPELTTDKYKIIKSFEAKDNKPRHSAKVIFNDTEDKRCYVKRE